MPRRIPTQSHISHILKSPIPRITLYRRFTSTQSHPQTPSARKNHDVTALPMPSNPKSQSQQKTVAQRDEELRQKMSGIAGDGGEAGVEYEDGKPVASEQFSEPFSSCFSDFQSTRFPIWAKTVFGSS
ncbi:hypothetical protein F4680DRAFT_446012 [Xylaria scruposa]|nr:hypothetical protein F4680DRAFT_446012 [Xylaria scruposa]